MTAIRISLYIKVSLVQMVNILHESIKGKVLPQKKLIEQHARIIYDMGLIIFI